jgi:hypothetical protein
MDKRIIGLFLLILLAFSFIVTTSFAGSASPAVPDNKSIIYYLKVLNKQLVGSSIPTVDNAELEKIGSQLDSQSTETKTKDEFLKENSSKISTKVNTFEWEFNDQVGTKSIYFPGVKYNDVDYGKLIVVVTRGGVIGVDVYAQVEVLGKTIKCGENSSFFGRFIDLWTNRLSLTFGNQRVCDTKIGSEPVVVLNLNRLVGVGKDKLIIKSPLIPDSFCKANSTDSKVYFVTCE